MWRVTLAVLCICITIGPPTAHGWDVKGRVDLSLVGLHRQLNINCTLVTKIPTDFLQGIRFTVGLATYVNKVVPQDWEKQYNELYVVRVTRTVAYRGENVHHHLMISPGYNPLFCWEPLRARVVTSTAVVKIGEPRTLTCHTKTNGTAPLTFKWYKSPGPTEYIHIGQKFELSASSIHESGVYSCGAQNECGKTKQSPGTKIDIEAPFLVEEETPPTSVTEDDLSFNITISGNPLYSPRIHKLNDTEEPSVQSRDIEGNFHYGQRKAKMFTMRWTVVATDGKWTCYNTSKKVNGEYILFVMFQETEKQVRFKVDMKCSPRKTPETDENIPAVGMPSQGELGPDGPKKALEIDQNKPVAGTSHSALGTGIGIGAGMILAVVLVVVTGYFIKKRLTKAQVDEMDLINQ